MMFDFYHNYILFFINRSAVLSNTLSPQWPDEEWIVRNVPLHAKLIVTCLR